MGMPEAQLREVNRIPERMLVKVGSTLLVPRGAHATANVAEHLADHAALSLTPEARAQRRRVFKAGKQGDTVAAVAKRYRVSAAQVAQWNSVAANARFKPGQAVTVMLAAAPARTVPRSAARLSPAQVTPTGHKVVKTGRPAARTRVAQLLQAPQARQAAPR